MSAWRARALFLDRDGVINYDKGYTWRREDFVFVEGIFDLCRTAHELGFLIIVVTNQAGIGRGYYSEQQFLGLSAWMCEQFQMKGVCIKEVFYCPYHPVHGVGAYKKESFDRKPNPGMILSAAEKYEIALERSILIGDKLTDMQAAARAGVGIRCCYLPDSNELDDISCVATHIISSLDQAGVVISSTLGRESLQE